MGFESDVENKGGCDIFKSLLFQVDFVFLSTNDFTFFDLMTKSEV